MKRQRTIFLFLFVFVFLVLFTACDDPIEVTFTSYIHNNSKENAWLWVGHGELDQTSVVAPGELKMLQITLKGVQKSNAADGNHHIVVADMIKINSSTDGKKVNTQKLAIDCNMYKNDGTPNIYLRFDGRSFSYDFGE